MKKSLVIVKLGGSIITDKKKAFTPNIKAISGLAGDLAKLKKKSNVNFIIGHGAGSFAHVPAAKYQTKQGIVDSVSLYGMCVTEDAAKELNRIVTKEFLKKNLPIFSFSPASFLLSNKQKNKLIFADPIIKALHLGLVPVVYGDVILDEGQGCTIFSTEKVLSVLALELRNIYDIKMIYLTDVDGVYDEKGNVIPKITPVNFQGIKKTLLGSKNVDVTGGMLHKVEEGLGLAEKYKIKTLIINGNKKDNLLKAVNLKKVFLGTIIEA